MIQPPPQAPLNVALPDTPARHGSGFRQWIRDDASSRFPVQPDRYHLYVSLACPWSQRTLIARELLGLHDVVSVSVLDPVVDRGGWRFSDAPDCVPDFVNHAASLREVYERAEPGFDRDATIPVLWDRQTNAIVNNESREILRMLSTELFALSPTKVDLYPEDQREWIDATLDWVHDGINTAVYRVGHAQSQAAYDEAVVGLFRALASAERRLAEHRFLCGRTLTEADICLFTTLYRFDPVYAIRFKCSVRRIEEYPNLSTFLRDVYQIPGIARTCNLDHVKQHYYRSDAHVETIGIIPNGPRRDLSRPHHRDLLGRRDGNPLATRGSGEPLRAGP